MFTPSEDKLYWRGMRSTLPSQHEQASSIAFYATGRCILPGAIHTAGRLRDFERARFNMVEQQIRPWEVLDRAVLDLMERAPRDAFVPNEYRRLAYADTAVPIGHGEAMLPPKVEGRLLQALGIGSEERCSRSAPAAGFLPGCSPSVRPTSPVSS